MFAKVEKKLNLVFFLKRISDADDYL